MAEAVLGAVIERRRYSTPHPAPQGLARIGDRLAISFRDVPHIYTFDPSSSRLNELCDVPDTAWGLATFDRRLWAVSGAPPDDDRCVYAFDSDGRPIGMPVRCPDATGSYLSHDGDSLYLTQWYRKRIFRQAVDGAFVPLLATQRGICGIACFDGGLALLTTDDEESTEYFITTIDLADPDRAGVDVARVPFRARSLVWTGATFLTNHRERGEIVEFSVPDSS